MNNFISNITRDDNFFGRNKLWLPSILGVSLILSAIFISIALSQIRATNDSLSVTGSATKEVVSDNAKFSGSFMRTVKISSLKYGYEQMRNDLAYVKSFLKEQGIDEANVTISTVSMYENYKYNSSGYETEKEYNLTQNVEVSSNDINQITNLAQATQKLIDKGVIFSTNAPQYFYSKLPELRVSLLSDAMADARVRAEQITKGSGSKVGALKSAASGVVQVLPSNSLEISDYGAYDTSTINKNVMVTVKATFSVK